MFVCFFYSYLENARELSKAYRDRPMSPLDTAVWWTEYVARGSGSKYLRSAGADLPWYQYYLLDVLLFTLLIVLAALYAFYRVARMLLLSRRRTSEPQSNEKKSNKVD